MKVRPLVKKLPIDMKLLLRVIWPDPPQEATKEVMAMGRALAIMGYLKPPYDLHALGIWD